MSFDPYFLGCLYNAALSSDADGIFYVTDQFCTLEVLYRLNEQYRQVLTDPLLSRSLTIGTTRISYGSVNGFRCVLGNLIRAASLPCDPKDKWSFITGVVDMQSTLSYTDGVLSLTLHLDPEWINTVRDYISIPANAEYTESGSITSITYQSTNVVDLFGKLNHPTDSIKHREFCRLIQNIPTTPHTFPICRVIRRDPLAVVPSKTRLSDVGYDLTIVRKVKNLTSNTALYDSGIALEIPFGFYVEVVPRSSLSKSGYMLANSIGIIDPGYTGNLYVALTKISPEAGEIEFPFRCCQLLFKKQYQVDLMEYRDQVDTTTRQDGGFGSTG